MNRLRSGFTLIELLVVVCIIAICAGLFINSLSFFATAMKKKNENKGEVKIEVKVEKPFSRFVVRTQELEVSNLSSGPYRLTYIQDTKTGQEWLAIRDHGLTPIISSTSAQSLKCEADNK